MSSPLLPRPAHRPARTALRATVTTATAAALAAGCLVTAAAAGAAPVAPATTGTAGAPHVVSRTAAPGTTLAGAVRGDAAAVATAQLPAVAELAGLTPGQLTVAAVRTDPSGASARYQQVEAGVPVRGAVVVASLLPDGALAAVNGRTSAVTAPAARPATTAGEAAAAATGKAAATEPGAYRVKDSTLEWYDPALARTGTGAAQLVYAVSVLPTAGQQVYGDVLVSAADNAVVADETQTSDALSRAICDADSGTVSTSAVCRSASADRAEGDAATGITDVDAAYDRFGSASDFYGSLGTDLTTLIGYNGSLSAVVRACPSGYGCPMQNAFWNGYGMVFGTGFTQADDVITHELTHGVTQEIINLQNGAINESLSDIFGEFEDIENGAGNDSASVAWLVGEDLPEIGAIRDMSDPPSSVESGPHPDRIGSPDFDYGGEVHGMSGPTSKTAYLITAGGSFNGYDVAGIGYAKAEALFWKLENTLTAYDGWQSFNSALASSCSALQSAGTLSASDCASVDDARSATELDQATDG